MPPFEELYRAYFAEVYRYALALCRHKETAEDVTAETFLKAMRQIGSFRGDCDFKVWLFTIAKNTYYSMLRKDAKLTGEPPEETAADAPTPEDAVFQAAELFGKTEHWACVTYHRAKEKLRKMLYIGI